ncbi:MAG: hypothetical protein EOP83_01715 [Verrucomicrobiaceae bacterium]|nr:MAG: hypothetical protein EOP83_01715 [Verrucomicrobiaceae bacterium]
MERLWSLALDERVGVSWRIAMALTLDLAYAESERLVHAAVACAEVHCNVNGASHWGEYARLFQKINNQQIPGLMGVAIGHTSANDPWAEWKHPIRDDQLPFQAVEYALMRRPSPYLGPQDVKA